MITPELQARTSKAAEAGDATAMTALGGILSTSEQYDKVEEWSAG